MRCYKRHQPVIHAQSLASEQQNPHFVLLLSVLFFRLSYILARSSTLDDCLLASHKETHKVERQCYKIPSPFYVSVPFIILLLVFVDYLFDFLVLII